MKYRKAQNSMPVPVRLPPEILDRLRILAESKGEAVSTMIRFAVHAGLPILERDLNVAADANEQIAVIEERSPEYKAKKKAG